jgi:glutaredoxin 3
MTTPASPKRVEMYSTMFCGYCARAKSLLHKKGVAFEDVDVMEHPERRDEMMERAGGRMTVPQIFIDGVHIGGSDELLALERAGKLDVLLGIAA